MSAENPIISEKSVLSEGYELFVREFNFLPESLANEKDPDTRHILWLHGWGQNGTCFLPVLDHFHGLCAKHWVIDFPGFGKSPAPKSDWGTEDYARFLLKIPGFLDKQWTVVGHSFGCRVAFRMASLLPDCIDRLCCIAAPGGAEGRSIGLRVRRFLGASGGKLFGAFDDFFATQWKARLSKRFGSRDYQHAQGILKRIMIKVVDERLNDVVGTIKCPVLLAYGSRDQETPTVIGRAYNKLMTNSLFIELPIFDHTTILSLGHHQLSNILQDFIKN